MKELTSVQNEILSFIKETVGSTGRPPTFREIQKHFGYRAVGTVQDHVKALVKKGVIESPTTGKKSRKSRALLPSDRPERVRQIPIYGEIAAGATREAEQLELGQLTIPFSAAKPECFALRVVGNSMVDAGIIEGDVLIVERTRFAKNGEIVVALLNHETTVKRYQERGGEILLVPENKTMKPIAVKGKELQIQGRVVGLQRRY